MATRSILLPLRIFGVRLRLDQSFLLVLPLFAYLIGSQLHAFVAQLASVGVPLDPSAFTGTRAYVLGSIAAIGLFSSVLVHEIGHALTARAYGIETKEIRLWFLGGVAQFEAIPRRRGVEAVIALAGPVTSAVLAAVLYGVMLLLPAASAARVVLSYLCVTNLGLALFNLLPALPLDGGRILRSILALYMPRLAATNLAVGVSGTVAIVLGVFALLGGQLYLALVAFFIYNAGRMESQATLISEAVYGRTVADLMTVNVASVESGMALGQFSRLSEFRPLDTYPVVDAVGLLLGVARLEDAPAAMAAGSTVVDDVLRDALRIGPSEHVMTVLQRLTEGDTGRLYVVDGGGRLIGVLSTSDLLRHIREFAGLQ